MLSFCRTVDGTLEYNGRSYTLALSGTLLTVTVDNSIFTGDLIDETKDITLGLRSSSVNILSSGVLNVYARGTAEVTTLNSRGVFNVYEGGTARDTVVNSCGSMYVGNGGNVVNTVVHDTGELHVLTGGIAVSTTIAADGGHMVVSRGGSAIDTVAEYTMGVFDGASVSNTTLKNRGYMLLYGASFDTIISSGGEVEIPEYISGAFASATTILDSGRMIVGDSGNTIQGVTMSGGSLFDSGSLIRGLNMYGGAAEIYGTVSGGTIAGGTMRIADFGSAVTLNVAGGEVSMAEHGYFNGTVTGTGKLRVGASVEVYDTTVKAGGRIAGSIQVNRGGLTFGEDGILDFNISRLAPENDALVTNYSFLDGMPEFTLTVTDSQGNGTYNLATGVESFGWNISVMNTSDILLGLLMIGRTVTIGGTDYTLNLGDDGLLSVTVGPYTPPGPEPPTPTADWIFFNGDYNGDGFDMLAVETPEQAGAQPASVAIYQNGEPWGLGVALDYGWEVVGSGDFNGNGLDDFLRVNGEGYVVGEMSNGNGTFSAQVLNLKSPGWDILGVGDFSGNGTDDVLIANPTGASETVGLLGYWESGATWTLINGYSPEWECVATGDFNGDGKCDMLWRNQFEGEGGGTYNAYCTWIVEDPVDWRMVSVANPTEWNFLCSGDFNGDKMNDIAMINDVGVVGIWGVNDGYLSSWSILSAVTPEWQLAGVADFNADGTDDIAWANTDTGLVGYWQIENKELASWANIATLS